MKIGILTFHCAHNYGAVLHSYLTGGREYSKFCGRILLTKNLRLLPQVFYTGIKLRKERNLKWEKFEKFISTKLNLYSAENFLGQQFDLCVVGSDQIWNKTLTGGRFDPLYFGVDFKCPIISYAASTIVDNYSEKDRKDLSKLLKKFSAISVREEKLGKQLHDYANVESTVVIDPTLLAGREAFEDLCMENSNTDDKYILVYTIRENSAVHKIANKLAKDNNLKVIEIASGFSLSRYDNKIYDAGIQDFLTIFKNARFVVTNSFHGTAFSLIFNKDFYAIKHNNSADDRISNLLNSIGLQSRFILPDSTPILSRIDYNSINDNINKIVKKSEEFIMQSLKSNSILKD